MVATERDGFDVVLRDGSTARVRPVAPEDESALSAFLEALSVSSRPLRFFGAGANLRLAARWAADVDGDRRFGLAALHGMPPQIVAHAAYVKSGPARAEVRSASSPRPAHSTPSS